MTRVISRSGSRNHRTGNSAAPRLLSRSLTLKQYPKHNGTEEERGFTADALRARVAELEAEKRDGFRMIGAIIAAAGGEVHVSPVHLIDDYTITREDQSMGATVFRTYLEPKP